MTSNLKRQTRLDDMEEQAVIELNLLTTFRTIEDVVTEIGTDQIDLMAFAY